MTDITQIPNEELIVDRFESLGDIKLCEIALSHGLTNYSGGSVQERLDTNKKIVTVIDEELKRRKIELDTI